MPAEDPAFLPEELPAVMSAGIIFSADSFEALLTFSLINHPKNQDMNTRNSGRPGLASTESEERHRIAQHGGLASHGRHENDYGEDDDEYDDDEYGDGNHPSSRYHDQEKEKRDYDGSSSRGNSGQQRNASGPISGR